MPSQVSSPTVNSNGLLPSTRMLPLTSGHPIKVENNSTSNTAAGSDLISRVVNQASPNGIGVSIDITV
mgnify:FL=1